MTDSPIRVFISYAREDYADARRLYEELKRAGVKPWLDTIDLLPGQQWEVEIKRAISECTYFIALLSWNSLSPRGYVRREMELALDILDDLSGHDVFVIPARINRCIPSNKRLKRLHFVDLWPSFDEGLQKILKVVQGAKEHVMPVLLEVFDIRWIGRGATAETHSGTMEPFEGICRYPFATILQAPSSGQICSFFDDACAVSFDAEVRVSVPWVVIHEIAVLVNSYCPLPKYSLSRVLPAQRAHAFYVEIDDPDVAGTDKFFAEYIFMEKEQRPLSVIRLYSGHPERFVVRVNAKTPGIYNFDLQLTVGHRDTKESINVDKSATFMFDMRGVRG